MGAIHTKEARARQPVASALRWLLAGGESFPKEFIVLDSKNMMGYSGSPVYVRTTRPASGVFSSGNVRTGWNLLGVVSARVREQFMTEVRATNQVCLTHVSTNLFCQNQTYHMQVCTNQVYANANAFDTVEMTENSDFTIVMPVDYLDDILRSERAVAFREAVAAFEKKKAEILPRLLDIQKRIEQEEAKGIDGFFAKGKLEREFEGLRTELEQPFESFQRKERSRQTSKPQPLPPPPMP